MSFTNYPMDMELGGAALFIGGTAGTNTYTAASDEYDGHKLGGPFAVRFTNANSGSSTLNINGLGAVSVVRGASTNIVSGEIQAGSIHTLVYNGTGFVLQSAGNRVQNASYADSAGSVGFAGVGNVSGLPSFSDTAIANNISLATALARLQGQINTRITTATVSMQLGSTSHTESNRWSVTPTVTTSVSAANRERTIMFASTSFEVVVSSSGSPSIVAPFVLQSSDWESTTQAAFRFYFSGYSSGSLLYRNGICRWTVCVLR
jgi:hypothetical protein